MKRYLLLFVLLLLVVSGCATVQEKYEPRPFTPPVKVPEYKLPVDPFANTSPPEMIFLRKDTSGKFVVCPKEEAELSAFTAKELQKITIRLQYYKTITSQLEDLVNIHIRRENVLIEVIIDQNILKELNREMVVDLRNKMSSDQFWNKLEKGGYVAVIIGLLIEMGVLIAK
jgi:hypothetical protein